MLRSRSKSFVKNLFNLFSMVLIIIQHQQPLFSFSSSSDPSIATMNNTIVVNILRLSSVPVLDASIDVALEVMRTHPEPALRSALERFQFNVVCKPTQRRATLNVRDTLHVAVDALSHNPFSGSSSNYFNTSSLSYALILGPDYSEEAEFVAQLAPMYNVITLTASASSDALSNMEYYPLLFRAGLSGSQILDATVKVARMTGVKKMAAVAIDEAYARERMQQLVHALRATSDGEEKNSVDFLLAAVVTKFSIDTVLATLASKQPFITLATTLDKRGGQIVCDAYLIGLSPAHTIWMFGGPFIDDEWWLPPPLEKLQSNNTKYYGDWNCTSSDILTALNGSFMVDFKVAMNLSDSSAMSRQVRQAQQQRVDRMQNVELQKMLLEAAHARHAPPPILGSFMMYDTVWTMAMALLSVTERLTRQNSKALVAATSANYFSPEYVDFSAALKEEMRKVSFYGATGLVEFDGNQARRGLIISIQQFQSDAHTQSGGWIVVGEVDAANNSSFLNSSKLRFGANFGRAPYDPDVNRTEIAPGRIDASYIASPYSNIAVFLPVSLLAAVFLLSVIVSWIVYKKSRKQINWLTRSQSTDSATNALDILITRSRITNLESVFTQTTSLSDILKKKLPTHLEDDGDANYRSLHNKHKRESIRSRRSGLHAASASSMSNSPARSSIISSTSSANLSSHGGEDYVRYLRRKRTQIGRLDYSVNVWVRDFVLQQYTPVVPDVVSSTMPVAREATSLSDVGSNIGGRFRRQRSKSDNASAAALLATTVVNEIHRLTRISHENINKMHGLILYDEKERMATSGMQGAILFQHQQSGSLFDVLHDDNIKLDNVMKYLFIRDIVNGLCALHAPSLNIAHGFLHTRNVVIDRRYTVLLTDYGLGFLRSNVICTPLTADRILELENSPKIDILLHMYLNRAPELLRGNIKQNWPPQCGTLAGDVYSLAMMTVEILTRQIPFADSAIYGMDRISSLVDALFLIVFDKVVARRPPCDGATFSPSLKALLAKCWHEDPQHRPNISSVQRELPKLPGFEHAAGSIVENLVMRLESYANNLEQIVTERTQALADEIAKSEQLLLQILPRTVADALKRGQRVVPESFESVSVYFSDIVGFTSLSARSTPMQVVAVLNKLYTLFDSTIEQFHVYKVETIGDAYMVASGLPDRIGKRHCIEIARMSLTLLENMCTFEVSHAAGELLTLRVGLHCGPCAAGVVGIKMPRYCLFGDTVNFASRMESNGEAYKIHTSSQYYEYVRTHFPNTYDFQCRGEIDIKGKGKMITYWLVTENFAPAITFSPGSSTRLSRASTAGSSKSGTTETTTTAAPTTIKHKKNHAHDSEAASTQNDNDQNFWLTPAARVKYSRKSSPTPLEQQNGLSHLTHPGSVENGE